MIKLGVLQYVYFSRRAFLIIHVILKKIRGIRDLIRKYFVFFSLYLCTQRKCVLYGFAGLLSINIPIQNSGFAGIAFARTGIY